MNRKSLGVIASVFLLFVLMLWFTQYQDEGTQTAISPRETKLVVNNAKPSATSNTTRNGSLDTRQHDRYAVQRALNVQTTSATTSLARNNANSSSSQNNFSPLDSANQTTTKAEPKPLEPRADPYALAANSGSVNVRFSVRLIGDADPATKVYLRQSGMDDVTAMNDQGVNGDVFAGDRIHGVTVPINTSALKPDTCLSYEAVLGEIISSPLRLCVSNLPVRTATSNIDNPVVFSDGSKAVADEILVTAQPGTRIADIQSLAASINATIVGTIPPLSLYQLKLAAPVPAAQLTALIAQLNARDEVKAASINAIGGYASTPNDTEYASQHGLQLVRANDVWDINATGNGVTTIVLDTGLNRTHPDFGTSPGHCQLAADDCGGTNDDAVGHGTQVAGVIGAKTNNAMGVAGVAYDGKIHSIQVSVDVSYTLAEMTQGFTDAATYISTHAAAKVINASFSVGPWAVVDVTPLCAAIDSAVLSGGVPVAVVASAAGNSNSNGYFYPSRCNDASRPQHAALTRKDLLITVANSVSVVDPACGSVAVDQRCSDSNYGTWVDITAPGSAIRTTDGGGGYVSAYGTSFSAPMVAGAAAILNSCGVALDQIESTLRTSANVVVPFPDATSAPRLDIYRALELRNRTPSALAISNNSLNDGTDTTAGVEVGTLTATDADTCDKWTYSIAGGADAARFSIGGSASDRLILTDGVLNSATKSSYAVTVHVTDFFGATFDQALTVNVTAVNNPPTISDQTFSINEGSANGTSVGTVVASDPDSGNVLSYSITAGNTSNAFSIDTGTGALSVNNTAALTANPTFSLSVTVTDGGLLSATATVTVNVNQAPVISNQTFSVDESSTNGTVVGAVAASDAGDTLSYSITAGNTGGAFSINSSTGVISVSAALSYATTPTYSLTVLVTDSGGLTASATITINVNAPATPANNAPVIANQAFTIDDGSANGTVVGLVLASDPDAGDSLSYSITTGNTDGAFAINPTTGTLTVSNSAAVSYASNPTFNLNVTVTDNGNLSSSATVTVNVNAPAAPPPSGGGVGGGGGCSVMPVGASPDFSLILAVLVGLGYWVHGRITRFRGKT